jgi:hypothetical protein
MHSLMEAFQVVQAQSFMIGMMPVRLLMIHIHYMMGPSVFQVLRKEIIILLPPMMKGVQIRYLFQ